MPTNIGKLRFVDFIKESTSVSVKFTLETSIIEMPTMSIIVAQDAKFGEFLEVNRAAGKQFRSKQLYIQAVSKSVPYFKV